MARVRTFKSFCSPLIAFASPGITNERETKAVLEALSQPADGYLLNIQGNCSHLEAKPAHMVGHLPLSSEQQDHFKALFAMFFLREDLHITHMMYAHRELGADSEIDNKWLDRLYEAQLLINYLYSTPHPLGNSSLHLEQASMYVFQVDNFSSGLIWPSDPQVDYSVENLAKDAHPTDKNVSGYYGLLNNSSYFWVVAGNRIYPPTLRLSLYAQQDLSLDLLRFWQQPKNWSVVDFLRGREHYDKEFDDRIITALEWHNRSTAQSNPTRNPTVRQGVW